MAESFNAGRTKFEYEESLTGDVKIVTPYVTMPVPMEELGAFMWHLTQLLREAEARKLGWRKGLVS